MTPLFKITILMTLYSFAFTSSAADMLCDFSEIDKTDNQYSFFDINNESCHDTKIKASSDKPQDDCCHDMNLCHASSLLSNNSSLNLIDIIHFTIPIMENDNLVINSSSPPDRPPKYNA